MQPALEPSLTWDARVRIVGIVAHSACTATEVAVQAVMWHFEYSMLGLYLVSRCERQRRDVDRLHHLHAARLCHLSSMMASTSAYLPLQYRAVP